jgi:hypothetical protein
LVFFADPPDISLSWSRADLFLLARVFLAPFDEGADDLMSFLASGAFFDDVDLVFFAAGFFFSSIFSFSSSVSSLDAFSLCDSFCADPVFGFDSDFEVLSFSSPELFPPLSSCF